MSKRIFRGIITAALVVFGAGLVLIMSLMYSYSSNMSWENLSSSAKFISAGVNEGGYSYLNSLEENRIRITWVNKDGTVLYDNTADANKMENHADRKEIKDAFEKGVGRVDRYSTTLSEKTLYYAILLEDGSVLRVSQTENSIWSILLGMSQPIVIVIMLAVFLSMFLAYEIAKRIVKPINEMDLEEPAENVPYPEMKPLLDRLEKQYQLIEQSVLDKEEMRREFSANVSHELKTPLTAISGTAEIMQSGMVKAEDVPHFAGNIYKESQRLITLVGDIMRISQLDEATVEMERCEVNLSDIVRQETKRLETRAKERNVNIMVRTPEEGMEQPIVYGVSQILQELVSNLIDNAIKYNKEHGQILAETFVVNDQAFISVKDTGIGIPKDDQNRVFERFYRVDKSHSKAVGGTGLGLSIVKHAAQFHDAEIKMESELGVGTKIVVAFPRRIR